MEIGPLFGLLTALFWAGADVLSRFTFKRTGYFLTCLYVQIFGLILLTALIPILGWSFSTSQPILVVPILLSGCCVFLSLMFLYRGFTEGLISIVAPIGGAYPLVTIVFSVTVLGQGISVAKAAEISLVILGILFTGAKFSFSRKNENAVTSIGTATMQKIGWKRLEVTRGVGSALLVVFFTGLGLFLQGYGASSSYGWFMTTVLIKISAVVFGLLVLICLRKDFQFPRRRTLFILIAMGVMDAAGFLAFSYGQ